MVAYSKLFPSNGPQRTSSEHDRSIQNAASIPGDEAGDRKVTQTLLFIEPSDMGSVSSERKNARPGFPRDEARRAWHWKTIGMIIGFLFAGQSALACN
jgi:hypothetical protein